MSGRRSGRFLLWVMLWAGAGLVLAPLAWMVLTSLKSYEEVLGPSWRWLPRVVRWENYAEVFALFPRFLANSLFVSALTIAGTVVSSALAGYAFARFRAPGKGIVFGLMLSAVMLPAQVTVVPLFRWYAGLGWIDTYWPLILPAWLGANVFAIFLMRQVFLAVPRDCIEAARVDGASEFRVFWSVAMPLAKPGVAAVAILSFVASWNDLWGPVVYLHDESLYTLPVGLLSMIAGTGRPEGSPWHLYMAAATLMVAPTTAILFLAQRWWLGEGVLWLGKPGRRGR